MMFYREEKKTAVKKIQSLKHLERIESPVLLLKDKKRQELLKQIHDNLKFHKENKTVLVQGLIEKVASFLQLLPETSLYYSHRGGLLDLALNRTEAALNLMHHLLVRDESELPSEQQQCWLYAVFSAGLLQGIGKLYSEYKVSLFDDHGQFIQLWRPLHEEMTAVGRHYSYEFTRDINEQGRQHITLLLAKQLMPEQGLAYLSSHPTIFYAWLALLEEDRDGTGPLDAIFDRANAIALQRYLSLYIEEYELMHEKQHARTGTFLDSTPETTPEREKVLGAEILLWIRDSLSEGKIILNQPPLTAEVAASGVVLSPEVFDMFMQEHLKFRNKALIQRAFHAWTQHNAKTGSLSKISLDNALLPESVKRYSAKTGRISTVSSLDLIQNMNAYSLEQDQKPTHFNQLNQSGEWTYSDNDPALQANLGIKSSG